MLRRSIFIPAILYFFSALTIIFALVQAVQILTQSLPEDSIRLSFAPISHFTHVVGGALFGIIGPIQFGRVLAGRYGRLHRIMGRVFVLCGFALALSSITLLLRFWGDAPLLLSSARLIFAIALAISLTLGMTAIFAKDIQRHKRWMIRAYAIGMGATVVSVIYIPIFAITGEPPMGLASDILFIGSWTLAVGIAERIIQRGKSPK